jgi:2-polyprenyl-3-methyl-5-hydroxy-6-metoxy-1,4-benzoquinol methylase
MTGTDERPRALTGDEFERHAADSVHFFSRAVPARLRRSLAAMTTGASIVDVGCGDGHLVWSLQQSGALPDKAKIMGVDLSPIRVRRFSELTGQPAVQANGERLEEIPSTTVDLGISTMVMEHVPDDDAYALALARIIKPGGTLYLTTVLRKPGAWYFRKAPDGRRVLDPTHVREYGDVDAVRSKLQRAGFDIVDLGLERLVFPIAHPLIRWWNASHPVRDVQRLFLSAPWSWIEKLALPIPRYREIQIVAKRRTGNDAQAHR